MAYTQSDLDQLQAAVSSGEREIQYSDGRRVQYRSIPELEGAIKIVKTEIAAQAAASLGGRTGQYRYTFVTQRD